MTKKKVAFLFGGPGAEHEVSLATAKSALSSFESEFLLLPVFITKDNLWVVANDYVASKKAWEVAQSLMHRSVVTADIGLDEIEKKLPDVVFIGLHGQFGEDGTVQALLEGRGMAFIGSNSEASAFAMDKPSVLQRLQDEVISVPEFLEVTDSVSHQDILDFIGYIGLPVVALPADSGSSVGVTIVKTLDDLDQAIQRAKHYSNRILITKYIKGREVTAGALVTSATELIALPPTELIPSNKHEFFDYDAKYVAGQTQEITPPHMDKEIIDRIKELALRVHRIVGADGYSRTDMILDDDDKLFVLEINTLPGLTATSLIPQQAKAYGLAFPQFLTMLCNNVDRSQGEYITAV